jgi:hypothetical protein
MDQERGWAPWRRPHLTLFGCELGLKLSGGSKEPQRHKVHYYIQAISHLLSLACGGP